MFRRLLTAWMVLGAAQFAGCGDGGRQDDGVEVSDAVIRKLLPGRTTTVAYFTLTNQSNVAVRLLNAHSPLVTRLELHTHVNNGDTIGMRRLDGVDLAPQQAVTFASGGHHLMAFGTTALPPIVPVTLEFSDGSTKVVEFRRVGFDGLEDAVEDAVEDALEDALEDDR